MAKFNRFKFSLYLVRDGKDLELSSVTLNLDKPNQGDILDAWQWMLVKHNCYLLPYQFGYIKASHFGFVLPVMDQPNLLHHLEGVTHLYKDFFPKMLNLYNPKVDYEKVLFRHR